MDVYQEPIEYQNPILCVKIWQLVNKGIEYPIDWIWHYHKPVEFIFMERGQLDVHTKDHVYHLKAGDSCVIGSSQLHFSRKIGEEELVYYVLHVEFSAYFDPAMQMYYRMFMEIDQPLDCLNYVLETNEAVKADIGRLFANIYREMHDRPKGYEIATSMHMKDLMLTLLRSDTLGILERQDAGGVQLLLPILAYVDEHLDDKIELQDVSALAHMSYSYFSKFFKKTMGISFTDYVNQKRIKKAELLLLTENWNVAQVAGGVGIVNMAHFYKLFKRYNGCTPKEFIGKLRIAL
ncbi:AraC family transcriptional regulator [Paenibacillus spongiae]|uniref:AraC family transcriptional regulator n=1 Tax=Paenibacillus spongiae TaxID=2909671 RepID=A0ABY5SAT5_9BACL|nr:AraC family transcriptional regulator [Paenibacillus spongiae]UVI31057.1 AraC family transcriptional regulator [Paenibacillus spongiae]